MGKSTHPSLVSPNAPFRSKFNTKDVDNALMEFRRVVDFRINQKGSFNLSSDFETIGTVDQEFMEFKNAVHGRLSENAKVNELYDVMMSALLGVLFHRATNGNVACPS